MSKLQSVQQSILQNPHYRLEVPYSFQLGFPRMKVMACGLCLTYYPHKVVKQGDAFLIYPPQFTFTFVYPSLKLITYSNFYYDAGNKKNRNEPICRIENVDCEDFVKKCTLLKEIGDTALKAWDGAENRCLIGTYQRTLQRVVEEFGIAERDSPL